MNNKENNIINTEKNFFTFTDNILHYKDISKNSSNPERTYEKLNLEIKNVTDNKKDLSYLSNSNSIINDQPECNEQFLNIKYWKNKENSRNQTQSPKQFSIKFEKIKKLELKKIKIKYQNQIIHQVYLNILQILMNFIQMN